LLTTSEQKALTEHIGLKVHNTKDLKDKLSALAKFIGCRDEIKPDMMKSIVKRIVTRYREFSYDDITNAFHYYLDRMEDDKKKIFVLDGLTISMVLNPYWGYLQRLKQKKRVLEGDIIIDEQTSVKILQTPETEKESFKFIAVYCSNNKTLPIGANWVWAFDYAFKNNLVHVETEEMDIEIRQENMRDRIQFESTRSREPKLYCRDNLTNEALERRMKIDIIQEYFKRLFVVTKHKYAL